MVREPAIASVPHTDVGNPYEGRWRWWYGNIADWMLRNPGKPLKDCAAELRKAENTIYYITQTKVFRDYYARRRLEWTREHDATLRSKLTQVAELALDSVAEKLTKQRDKVELPFLTTLVETSLDRLGFAPNKTPAVQVNVGDNRTQVVQLPGSVSATALEEARMALRAAQSNFAPRQTAIEDRGGGGDSPVLDALFSDLEPELETELSPLGAEPGPLSRSVETEE